MRSVFRAVLVIFFAASACTIGGTSSTHSPQPSAWGMEWETFDSVDKVNAFYAARLNQGDWAVTFSGPANGGFTAIFTRKSNPKVEGILGLDGSSGLTKISLALAGS